MFTLSGWWQQQQKIELNFWMALIESAFSSDKITSFSTDIEVFFPFVKRGRKIFCDKASWENSQKSKKKNTIQK